MGIVDFVLIGLIVTGAVYLLYRSIWKKGGYCHGCSSSGKCGQDPRGEPPTERGFPNGPRRAR
jgi:hypothetical protein